MEGLDLDPHHRSQPALLSIQLELAHQVFGLFLEFHVAVHGPRRNMPWAVTSVPGNRWSEEQRQQRFQGQETAGLAERAAPA